MLKSVLLFQKIFINQSYQEELSNLANFYYIKIQKMVNKNH